MSTLVKIKLLPHHQRHHLGYLVDLVTMGIQNIDRKNGSTSLKPKAWHAVAAEFYEITGNLLRKEYAMVQKLYGLSGMGGAEGSIEASPETWRDIEKFVAM